MVMSIKKKIFLLLTLITSLYSLIPVVQSSCSGEIDMTTVVSWVIDGDTFDTTSGERIRLADVDAPEYEEIGYNEAKNLLISLIYDKEVHLDIDDIYRTDPYDRLVCVVYLQYNSTHFMNINKALLVEDVAVVNDYDNEFNPYTWSLYCPIEAIPEFPSFLVLPLFILATLPVAIFYRRKHSQARMK